MQPFDYVKPTSLEEAGELLLKHNGSARPFAGMTDLLIRIERGFVYPEIVVDIKDIPGMRDLLVVRNGDLRIGAAVTMNEVAAHSGVQTGWPLLAEGCASVASYQLRNRAPSAAISAMPPQPPTARLRCCATRPSPIFSALKARAKCRWASSSSDRAKPRSNPASF